MLLEITMENVALIDKLHLELGRGLNILTGETGAGKSIVVDALTLVLGGRADKTLIRTGTTRARVEAVFDVRENAEVRALLDELSLEYEGGVIALARELSENRSVCRVCATVVPLQFLRRVAEALVELHGQHEHQQLIDPARHLQFLDGYGDEAHQAARQAVREAYARYENLGREADQLRLDAAEMARRRDMLAFQLGEIDAVKPKAGEEEKLSRKNELLRNAEKVAEGIGEAYDLVYRGGGRTVSAQASLKRAAAAMDGLCGLDERFDRLKARLDELYYAAEDVGYELQALEEGLEFNPAQADKVAQRLSEIKQLTRKYGPTVEDVLAFRAKAAEDLAAIDGGEDRLRELEAARAKEAVRLKAACADLSARRHALAQELTGRLLSELKDLGMAKARFEVRFAQDGGYSAEGGEKVSFMLSANLGEPLKPLAAVASGGELSRIMLAMKTVAADSAGVDAMVFDEVDTGVSGRMAQVVGEKMAAIARKRQVICVTHLPQIAALGDRQYLVEKTTDGARTGSTVKLLDRAGRIEALARMVGGAEDNQSARDHARNLLDAAQTLVKRQG
ncbi:MAG: DNA repair protein RecN [Clostridia bacterium]